MPAVSGLSPDPTLNCPVVKVPLLMLRVAVVDNWLPTVMTPMLAVRAPESVSEPALTVAAPVLVLIPSSVLGRSGAQLPISPFYSLRAVNNSDLEYFIESFDLKYGKFREVYLLNKETLMAFSHRYSHYSPLDFERHAKDKVDRLLARWEQWFVRTLELAKGVSHLKKEFLIKKQYEASGLSITESRRQELVNGYCHLVYQYEINEKDRSDILAALDDIKRESYASVPGLYELYKAKEEGGGNPYMKLGSSASLDFVDPPPKLSCTRC